MTAYGAPGFLAAYNAGPDRLDLFWPVGAACRTRR